MDLGLVSGGLIPVFLFFRAAGGELLLGKAEMAVYIAVACLVAFFYKALWLLADRDSPGMVWTSLRLVNFDNQPPTRKQRVCRLAGACLSFASAGLGLIWALADQEKLTWHDHISKTFPTPSR
ncbi:MAG: RDD family protein [Bryobacteraceae bacterium]|nr:RDD family protein [Bryobacteraceae bacterium]